MLAMIIIGSSSSMSIIGFMLFALAVLTQIGFARREMNGR